MRPRTSGTTMLGGIAFLLMTASIFLATRPAGLEDWFGGLDRMYQVHKIMGVASLLFVLTHFFFVPKSLPEGVDPIANPLVPSGPFGMIAMILLVLSLALALNRKISYSRWRPVHKVMGLVYILIIAHFMSAPARFRRDLQRLGHPARARRDRRRAVVLLLGLRDEQAHRAEATRSPR